MFMKNIWEENCKISVHCKCSAGILFNTHFLLTWKYYKIMIGYSAPLFVLPSAVFPEDSVKRHLKPCSAVVRVLYKVQSDGDNS